MIGKYFASLYAIVRRWLAHKHKWSKAYDGALNGSVLNYHIKKCKSCGEVRPVKRRVKKEKV